MNRKVIAHTVALALLAASAQAGYCEISWQRALTAMTVRANAHRKIALDAHAQQQFAKKQADAQAQRTHNFATRLLMLARQAHQLVD